MWHYRRALRVYYVEHMSSVEMLDRVGQERQLQNRITLHRLRYFGHIARHPSLEKEVMLGMMPAIRPVLNYTAW